MDINSYTPISVDTIRMILSSENQKRMYKYAQYQSMNMILREYKDYSPWFFQKRLSIIEWASQKVSDFGYKIERCKTYRFYGSPFDGFFQEMNTAAKYSTTGIVYCTDDTVKTLEGINEKVTHWKIQEEMESAISKNKELWDYLTTKLRYPHENI